MTKKKIIIGIVAAAVITAVAVAATNANKNAIEGIWKSPDDSITDNPAGTYCFLPKGELIIFGDTHTLSGTWKQKRKSGDYDIKIFVTPATTDTMPVRKVIRMTFEGKLSGDTLKILKDGKLIATYSRTRAL